MTSGLGEELSWVTSADVGRTIVEDPFFDSPRGSFSYSSAGTQLVGAALEHATGESLLSYGRKKLFEPLGIVTEPRGTRHRGPLRETEPTFGWAHDGRGHYIAGTGLRLRGIDMAKLGLLYLHGGEWEGRRVVPRSWIDAATRRRSDGGFPENAPYGFLTWLPREHGRRAFLMAGFGGPVHRRRSVAPARDRHQLADSADPRDAGDPHPHRRSGPSAMTRWSAGFDSPRPIWNVTAHTFM